MNEAYEKVCEKITEQQKTLKNSEPAFFVGEHIKDILKKAPEAASEIVLADLELSEMSIVECEKKIKAYADKHKKGNFSFVPADVAEGIICDFYKIGKIVGNLKFPSDCESEKDGGNNSENRFPNDCESGKNTDNSSSFLNLEDFI